MRTMTKMLGVLALLALLLPGDAMARGQSLRQGWQMTVTATGSAGTLTRLANEPDVGGDDVTSYSIAAGESLTVGPFGRPTRWDLSSTLSETFNRYPELDATFVGVGAGVTGIGVTVTETGDGAVHKTVLTLTDVAVALSDNAGTIAYGGLKLYDWPEGLIAIQGASMDIALTKSSAGVNADWDGDTALGSVTATNDASLATTEQNIIPTTATPQASSGVTTGDGLSTATEAVTVLNGTSTAADLYLNYLVDDADHDVTSTPCNLIANGTITIVWSNLGDI